jgi:ATP synthase subunit 6
MLTKLLFFSPLEQFYILPIITFDIIPYVFSFSIDNIVITLFLLLIFLSFFIYSLKKNNNNSFLIIPNRWQLLFENNFLIAASLIQENIQADTRTRFFPLIASVFFFILNINLFGIIPYTFTVTSQLIVTFSLGLFIFIGIHIIAVKKHKIKIFSLFFPSGVSVALSILLVPIEIISFIFKPISISTRLFANMMAGHILLKVIAGAVWGIMAVNSIFSILHFIPLIILIILIVLEFGVAVIQSFVFTILLCIYINDIFNLH